MDKVQGINVRQRQYAFAKNGTDKNLLVTSNIFVCTTWFGFDKNKGLAFLCHFDSEKSTSELPRIVNELNELSPGKLNIESYILNGSTIANCMRTTNVRKTIANQAMALKYCRHKPADLGYSSNKYRSRVYVSANELEWLREDYVFSMPAKVSAISKTMSKASGSA